MRPPEWVEYAITRLMLDLGRVYAVLLGFLIVLGGDDRLQGPSFVTLIQWAPSWVWGSSLAAAGMLATVPNIRLRIVGFGLAATWFWVWTSALLVNLTLEVPGMGGAVPALTGPPTYLTMAVAYTAFTVALYMSREESRGARKS